MIALSSLARRRSVVSPKTCYACKAVLPIEEFYKHPKSAGGVMGKCKACHRAHITANRWNNLERIRQYDRDRGKQPHRKAAQVQRTKKKRQSDSRYMRCHNAVARALKKGVLQRSNCERCGHEKSMAHHDSYDHPLQVMWLCQPCHKQRHKELDAMAAAI
jgi:uncharacterized OB-fold protein